MFWSSTFKAFVMAFAALFPVINPIGSAVLYSRIAQAIDPQERRPIALRIGCNVGIVLIVATWAGTALLQCFGVGIGALRIAGGLVISVQAWHLLADSRGEDATAAAPSAVVATPVPHSADDPVHDRAWLASGGNGDRLIAAGRLP
jgi:small neutral amino acid transporter SnatA (MarC family)